MTINWTGANSAFTSWMDGLVSQQVEATRGVLEPVATGSMSRLIVQAPSKEWRESVERKLGELVCLPRGWDGYLANPVSFETATFAVRMLESVCASTAPAPQIVPGVNGDLQIEWHTEKGDVELHVRRANSVHAWRRTPATDDDGEDLDLTVNFLPIVTWVEEISELNANEAAAA